MSYIDKWIKKFFKNGAGSMVSRHPQDRYQNEMGKAFDDALVIMRNKPQRELRIGDIEITATYLHDAIFDVSDIFHINNEIITIRVSYSNIIVLDVCHNRAFSDIEYNEFHYGEWCNTLGLFASEVRLGQSEKEYQDLITRFAPLSYIDK